MIPFALRHPFARLCWFSLIVGLVLSLGPTTFSSQPVGAAPLTVITKDDAFAPSGDVNGNGLVEPGDTLRYTVDITNPSGTDMTGVQFTDTIDLNTTIVAGSLTATPVAVDDGYATNFNTALPITAPGVLTNDSDPDGSGGVFAVAIVAGATTQGGTIDLATDGSFTYQPPIGFVGTDTFSYTIGDGEGNNASATVTITVNEVFPTATDDAYTTDAGVNLPVAAPGVLANDSGGGLSTTAIVGGATTQGGIINLATDGSFTYQPPPNFSGTDTFTYTVSNTVGSANATVTITVNEVAPVANDDSYITSFGTTDSANNVMTNDLPGGSATVVVNYGAPPVTPGTAFTLPGSNGITVTLDANGNLTIDSTAGTAIPGTYTFDYQIANGAGNDTAQVSIEVRQGPVANDDFTAATPILSVNAGNTGTSVASVLDNDNLGSPTATLTSFGGGTLPGSPLALAGGQITVTAAGLVQWTTAPTLPGDYNFDYLIGNVQGNDTATVFVRVQAPPAANDDAPYTVVSGNTLTITTGDPNDLLDNDNRGFPLANIVSFGGGDAGGTVTSNLANANLTPIPTFGDGALQVNANGSFTFTPPTLPTPFCGDFDFDYRLSNGVAPDSDATVTITVQCAPVAQDDLFNSGFTIGAGGELSLTGDLFANNGSGADFLGNPPATISSFYGGSLVGGPFTPGNSTSLAGGTLTVNADGTITLANATVPGTYTFQYDLTNSVATDTATVTIDVDDAPEVTTTTPTNGAVNVPPSSTITINFDENVDVAAGGITVECPVGTSIAFTPTTATNTNTITITPTTSLPGNEVCTVTVVAANVTDTDANDPPNPLDGNGDGNPGDNYVFSFTVAPEAVDDAYTVNPHLTYDSPTSVSVNDNPPTAIITGFGQTAGTATTVPDGVNTITAGGAGGTVRMNADGTFTYFPPPDVSNDTATFFYAVTGGDTAQVTLTISNDALIWFVDASYAGANGVSDGTQTRPFTLLAGAAGSFDTTASDNVGDYIFIADGSYTCGVTLLNTQSVIGDGSSSDLATITGLTPVAGSTLPAFSGTDPVLSNAGGDCLTLGQDNTLRGFTVDNTSGYAITGTNLGTTTLTESSITGSGGLFNLTTGGTFNAAFDTLSSSGHTGVMLNLNTIGGTISNTNNSSITHAAAGVDTVNIADGSPNLTYNGAITKSGTGQLLRLTNIGGGTITFQNGTVSASAGDGIVYSNADGTVNFNGTTTLSGNARVNINNGSNGTFNFANGTITNPNIPAFVIFDSAPQGTFTGSIFANSDFVLDVDNMTGNSYTFNGTLTSTAGAGARIVNSEGNITINTLTLGSSGAPLGSDALTLTNNTGTYTFTTLNSFTSGALPRAIVATNGGTVNSSNGTVSAVGAEAVTISNTALGMTLTSVSANGGPNGILLNTTTGNFTVTGTGAAGTGGTIQNQTSDAVQLTTASGVSFAYMNIQNSLESGILGTNVTGLNLNTVNVTNNGDDSADTGIRVNNLWGTSTWTNVAVVQSELANVIIENTSGTLASLTVTNSNFNNLGAAFGGNSILMYIHGTAQVTSASITGSFFQNNGLARGLTVQAQETSTISNFTATGNTFASNGLHVSFEQAHSANLTFNFSSNTLNNANPLHAINVFSSSTSTGGTVQGRIQNNNIGNAGVGSTTGNGIRVFIQSQTGGIFLIDGNFISQTPQARGIEVTSQSAAGVDVTLTNNDVDPQDTTGFPLAAIFVNADDAGSGASLRADIRGNTVPAATNSWDYPSFDGTGSYLVLEELTGATTQLVDNPPGPGGQTATQQLQSTNTGSSYANSGVALIAGPIGLPPLRAAGGEYSGLPVPTIPLRATETSRVEAIVRWSATGLTAEQIAQLETINLSVADLPDGVLAYAYPDHIEVDAAAAGYGWFVDTTPHDDAEFSQIIAPTEFRANADSPAYGQMDLLTAIMHEYGHILGLDDLPTEDNPHALMADMLPTGTRRFPVAQMVTAKADESLLKPSAAPAMSGETINVNIGTLPAGETVTITFDVTVDNPLPAGITQVCNQGTVSGNLGATPFTEVTDDPATGAADDPTCTLVNAAPVMSASKTAVDVNGGNTVPGDVIEYTIAIGNTGNQDAGGTTLTDPIPANTTYVAGSTTLNGGAVADVGGAMPYASGGLVNSPAALAGVVEAGQTATVVFQVTVNDPFPTGVTSISNQGTVSGVGFTTISTDDPGAGGGSDPTTITIIAGLTFTKAFLTDPIQIGDTTTLQFTITNPAGNPALTNLSFTDDLPIGLVYVAPATTPQCGGTVTLVDADTLAFSGGSLGAGASACTIDVTVQSDGANTGLLTNTSSALTATGGINAPAATDTIFVGTPPTATPIGGGVSAFPTPPATPLCVDHNFDVSSPVRASVPDAYRTAVFCRVIVQDRDYVFHNGYYLTHPDQIGHQGVLDLGVEQAVDVFSPTGPRMYQDGAVICLRGTGTMLFLSANQAPRTAQYMTTYSVDDFPGYTCVTLTEPGTLVLVRGTGEEPETQEAGGITELSACTITTQYMARFRQTPGLDGEILGHLPYLARLESTGYVPGWYRVIFGDTQGWVSASLVTTEGDCGV